MSQPTQLALVAPSPGVLPRSATDTLHAWIDQWKRQWNRHGNSTARPPLTLEDLVVIALFIKRQATASEIQEWVFESFLYYRRLAYSVTSRRITAGYREDIPHEATVFIQQLKEVFLSSTVPIEKVSGHDLGIELETDAWTIYPNNALTFLATRYPVFRPPTTPFRFLDLPAELRLRIYTMVFGYPRSGVSIKSARRGPFITRASGRLVAKILTRDYNRAANFADWEENPRLALFDEYLLNAPSFPRFFSLLLVNREIYEEAMPVFYSTNNFVFTNMNTFHSVLVSTAMNRRRHMGKITFEYLPRDRSVGAKVFRLLKEIEFLQELEIHFSESAWQAQKRKDGTPMFPDVLKVPGFKDLRGVKGLQKVSFIGDCEHVRGHLEGEMVKPKGKDGVKKKAR